MKRSRILPFLAVALAVAFGITVTVSSIALADIRQEVYERLKRDAEEVLIVELKSVKKKSDNDATVDVQVEATVREVIRSRSNLQPNDHLTFASYYVKKEALQRGFVGPQSPPVLRSGETYKVYLSRELTPIPDLLGPAAYGQSFKKITSGNAATPQPRIEPTRRQPQAGQMAEVIVSPANVMDAERVLATIPKGTTLKIYSIQQGWAEVKIPQSTQRGWVKITDLRAKDR